MISRTPSCDSARVPRVAFWLCSLSAVVAFATTPLPARADTPTPTATEAETPTPEPTATATDEPTPTETDTATPTDEPTPGPATATPTAEATPSGTCGDGTRDTGEDCDDGGTDGGDGCSATCTSELVIGIASNRVGKGDCLVEWLTSPVPPPGKSGLPRPFFECRDDDPNCDVGTPGDAQCTFRITLCLNVSDERAIDPATDAPACSTVGIEHIALTSPSERSRRGSVDAENRAAIEAALAEVGGPFVGRCRAGQKGATCGHDTECDSGPNVGDGRCRGRLHRFSPDLMTRDVCTSAVEVRVPLKPSLTGFRPRTSRIRLTTLPPFAPGANFRRTARDSIMLVCRPAAG